MALKKTLAQRLFNFSKCRLSTPSSAARIPPPPPPDPSAAASLRRRFLHLSTAAPPPELRSISLLDRLRAANSASDRLRLDCLTPPPAVSPATPPPSTAVAPAEMLTVEDARKVLRVSQLETIKSKIRGLIRNEKDCVFFEEFLSVCSEGCGSRELGAEFARMLDEAGHVIVLGNLVFLRPDQVVKIVQGLMPSPGSQPNDPRWIEFEEMEKQKSAIDQKAESLVRRELWCGLGYLIIQTAGFMRLTFWELTWDVMEPICFYVTSVYFMAGYGFFLRTKIEPSFEGFFQNRFSSKQKRLMKKLDFDVERYNELLRAFYPESAPLPVIPSFDRTERAVAGAGINHY